VYVHLDWHIGAYAKAILDEVFGIDNFVNEIVWKRKGGSANPQNRYGIVTDTIYLYTKSENYTFQPDFSLSSDEAKQYIKERFRNQHNNRVYMLAPIERNAALGVRKNLIYEYKGYAPQYGWMVSRDKLEQMDHANSGKI
jgi:adenine-specific DNA-methyltransferase